ncbi:hypothetical protein YC2023_037723 [Brassica napus]
MIDSVYTGVARKGGRLSSPQVATRHGERSGRLLKPRLEGQKEFYKNAKYVSKFRKSMKQHDKEVKLQSFREEDETGDSSRVVGDDDKRKGKSHKRIGVDEVYKQTREVMEKARMEREAALQAKREAKEEAESLRRVAKGKMMRKTRHGQPVMKYRIEHLLESIKKSAENDGSRTA